VAAARWPHGGFEAESLNGEPSEDLPLGGRQFLGVDQPTRLEGAEETQKVGQRWEDVRRD
jgi:hypothetical protein